MSLNIELQKIIRTNTVIYFAYGVDLGFVDGLECLLAPKLSISVYKFIIIFFNMEATPKVILFTKF